MRPPTRARWELPPYRSPGRAAAFRHEQHSGRVLLIVDSVEYIADLSGSDVRNLREWLEQVERDIRETPRGPGDADG